MGSVLSKLKMFILEEQEVGIEQKAVKIVLKVLEEMPTKVLVPVAVPKEEEKGHPLEWLPEELWLEVISKLEVDEDPADLISVSGTCSWFKELLQDIMARYRLSEVIPFVLKYLSKKNILQLRLVCKAMRKSTDKVLDSVERCSRVNHLNILPKLHPSPLSSRHVESFEWRHFHNLKTFEGHRGADNCDPNYYGIRIEFREEVEQLFVQLEKYRVRKVVGKRCELIMSKVQSLEIFHQHFVNFLLFCELLTRKLGHEIDHLLLRLQLPIQLMCECAPILYFGDIVEGISTHIISAELHVSFYMMDEPERVFMQAQPNSPIGQRFPRSIVAPCLENLSIAWYPIIPECLRDIAIQYGVCLKTLQICLFIGRHDITQCPTRLKVMNDCVFPSLLDFTLRLDWWSMPYLDRMHAAQLKRLSLKLYGTPSVTNIVDLVRTVHHFDSLSILVLGNRPGHYDDTDYSKAYELTKSMRHSNLKHLILRDWWYNLPLNFFTRLFPNLTYIQVQVYPVEETRNDPRREIDPDLDLLYKHEMEKSKIWEDLTKLERVTFQYGYKDSPEYICYLPHRR